MVIVSCHLFCAVKAGWVQPLRLLRLGLASFMSSDLCFLLSGLRFFRVIGTYNFLRAKARASARAKVRATIICLLSSRIRLFFYFPAWDLSNVSLLLAFLGGSSFFLFICCPQIYFNYFGDWVLQLSHICAHVSVFTICSAPLTPCHLVHWIPVSGNNFSVYTPLLRHLSSSVICSCLCYCWVVHCFKWLHRRRLAFFHGCLTLHFF